MKKLTIRQILILAIALFSMFFGSGNLIFPPDRIWNQCRRIPDSWNHCHCKIRHTEFSC